MRPSPPDKARSDSPPGGSQPIYGQSYDYRAGYNGQATGASASTSATGHHDPFNIGRARGTSVSGSYSGHTGQNYTHGHHSQSPSLGGDHYGTSYQSAQSAQSETRSSYPSVTDETVETRLYHRTSTSNSHPYHREQPHVSSIIKSERGDGFGNTYNDIKMPAIDPFMNDTGVASVSRLGRQVWHSLVYCHSSM
jgi:hypothetical protein